jgi:hypothetical protein
MPLPSDFDETLARVQKLGITAEEPGKIRDHLVLAISTVAEQGQKSGDLAVGDLGFLDWSTKTLRRCEEAIHDEVCDEAKGQLKEEYKTLMDKATSDSNVRQIAVVVTNVLAVINPAIAVSSVVVYFALWLAKVGLNYWCKQPFALAKS